MVALHRELRVAEVVERLGVAGRECNRALEALQRLGGVPGLRECNPEIGQCGRFVGIAGIDVDRPPDQLDRVPLCTLLHPGDPQHVERVEVHGNLREDFAVQPLGVLELAALVMTDGPLELGRDRRRGRSLSDGFPRAMFDHCRC